MIKDAQKARAEKYLNSLIRHDGKVITVKEWLQALKDDGYSPCVETMRDDAKEEKEKERLRLVFGSWGFPLGNPNHPEHKQYLEDKAELEKGIFKIVYVMRKYPHSYVITKTAYDYLLGENQ